MANKSTRKIILPLDYVLPIILLLAVLLAFVVAGILLGQNKYFTEANFNSANYGDEILVDRLLQDYSTTWCGAYSINPWEYANITLLPDKPDIDSNYFRYTEIEIQNSMMGRNVYDQRGAFLLKGSIISLNVCRELPTNVEMEILVIKGDELWNKWSKNQYECGDCALVTKTIPLDILCGNDESGKQEILNFTVTEDNFYHAVISRKFRKDEPKSVYLTYDLTLARRIYDIPVNNVPVCSHVRNTCTVNLDHNSKQQILISFEENLRLGGQVFYQHRCKAYLALWITVFGLVPLCIIVSTVILLVVIFRRKKPPEMTRLVMN